MGITLLPETVCADAVRAGELEVVLPQWRLPQGIFHAVFASRRGMLPAVRVFIDFLAERVPGLVETARLSVPRHQGRALQRDGAGGLPAGRVAVACPRSRVRHRARMTLPWRNAADRVAMVDGRNASERWPSGLRHRS